MSSSAPISEASKRSLHRAVIVILAFIFVIAAYLRFEGLGVRSLWWDEMCTWHVSQLDLAESLRWEPELTQGPLYQLSLRIVSENPRPPEWVLRLPAAVCGFLVVVCAWWLGIRAGGWGVGLAYAALLAINPLQIQYSREARGYSMLLLGAVLTIGLWHHLVTSRSWRAAVRYVIAAVLAVHAHYLAVLVIGAQLLWWMVIVRFLPPSRRSPTPFYAWLAAATLCVPVVYRHFRFRPSAFPGLEWIDAPTWSRAVDVISGPTFGRLWMFGVLATTIAVWLYGAVAARRKKTAPVVLGRVFSGREDLCGLLWVCWVFSWAGLVFISLVAQPVLVMRYALPVAIPGLLLPLIVAHRVHPKVPVLLAAITLIATSPKWMSRDVAPGFRELAAYLREHADPQRDLVVVALESTGHHEWHEADRLGFDYYPVPGLSMAELELQRNGVTPRNEVLRDPRPLFLVVLRTDPFAILGAAGRTPVPIEYEGRSYSQLLFSPYRLVRVAPAR